MDICDIRGSTDVLQYWKKGKWNDINERKMDGNTKIDGKQKNQVGEKSVPPELSPNLWNTFNCRLTLHSDLLWKRDSILVDPL